MIHVTCPKCSKAYNLGDDKAGRTFRCQQCEGNVSVPLSAQADDPFAPEWKSKIPEAKPYGTSGIPEAIPMAEIRGSSSSRPSGGGSGLLIGLGAGLVLFAIAASVIFVFLRQRNPPIDGVPIVRNSQPLTVDSEAATSMRPDGSSSLINPEPNPPSPQPQATQAPPQRPAQEPGPTTPESPSTGVVVVRPPPLAIDLERMQTAVDVGELATFVTSFYPEGVADSLAGSRQQAEVDRLRGLPANRNTGELMRALLHATPAFSSDGREATFRVSLDIVPGETPSIPEATGYGDDLEVALQSAIESLDSGAIPTFVSNMFPVTELIRLRDNTDVQIHLDTRLQVYPAMVETMKTELQECLDAGLTQGKTIAEAILLNGRRTPRVVRFQLVGGHWRFFDPGPPPAADAEAEFETVTLVHDGEAWRLKVLPQCLER